MITNLSDQLTRDEGLRLHPYRDTVGKLTIGIGRNLDDRGITLVEADYLLANDIKDATDSLEANFPWVMDLDDARKGALLNLTFNMGVRGLAKFVNFLTAMKVGEWATAKAELLNSAADHEEPARIARLALQIETGFWQ